jgi:hypothetical protein
MTAAAASRAYASETAERKFVCSNHAARHDFNHLWISRPWSVLLVSHPRSRFSRHRQGGIQVSPLRVCHPGVRGSRCNDAVVRESWECIIRNDGVGGSNPSCGTTQALDLIVYFVGIFGSLAAERGRGNTGETRTPKSGLTVTTDGWHRKVAAISGMGHRTHRSYGACTAPALREEVRTELLLRGPYQEVPAGSAPRSGRGGRRFKSCHSDQLSHH